MTKSSDAVKTATSSRKNVLRDLDRVSSIFKPEPRKKCLHLVVDYAGRLFRIFCIVKAEECCVSRIFGVEVESTKTVSHLIDKIREEPAVKYYYECVGRITLRWVLVSTENLEQSLENTEGLILDPTSALSVVFPSLPCRCVHVLVEMEEVSIDPLGRVLSPNVKQKWEQFVKVRRWMPPSLAGQALYFANRQGISEKILCNRPPDATASIPVMLLHPEFLDNCRNHEVTSGDAQFALMLSHTMSGFHEGEERRAAIGRVFSKYGVHFVTTGVEYIVILNVD
ncbi:hypothetical protein AX15_007896 [Amanita polypyramis BW_CC]|nr:hypothetical protein AX15_007896 [Amanita polypyramis BW_CC]